MRLIDRHSKQVNAAERGNNVAMIHMVYSKRALMAMLMLIGGLVAGSIGAQRASAYIGACDTDPVFVLSNGMTVTVTTAIADNPKDVNSVVYTLHVPQGVTLDHVQSRGRLRRVETILFSADQAPNTYLADTVVSTGAKGVAVTTTVDPAEVLSSHQTITLAVSSTSGYTSQDVSVSLTG